MNDPQKLLVGERIASIRDKHNKTLEEFGKIIDNATKSNVSKWEKGEVLPNRKRLQLIADFDGTTVEYLLTGIELRDMLGNLMPEGLRLFDYNFIDHYEKKLKNSPVRVIYSFIKISNDGTYYYGGIRSSIVLGNVDITLRNATITVLSETLGKNEFYNSAALSNVNFDSHKPLFVNCDAYLNSVNLRDKNFRVAFLNHLINEVLNKLKQDNEIPFDDIEFKGTFHYFRHGITEIIPLIIGK